MCAQLETQDKIYGCILIGVVRTRFHIRVRFLWQGSLSAPFHTRREPGPPCSSSTIRCPIRQYIWTRQKSTERTALVRADSMMERISPTGSFIMHRVINEACKLLQMYKKYMRYSNYHCGANDFITML